MLLLLTFSCSTSVTAATPATDQPSHPEPAVVVEPNKKRRRYRYKNKDDNQLQGTAASSSNGGPASISNGRPIVIPDNGNIDFNPLDARFAVPISWR